MILAFKIMIARLGYGRDAVTFSVISTNFGMRMAPAREQFSLPKSAYIDLINTGVGCGEGLILFCSTLVGFLAPSMRTKMQRAIYSSSKTRLRWEAEQNGSPRRSLPSFPRGCGLLITGIMLPLFAGTLRLSP